MTVTLTEKGEGVQLDLYISSKGKRQLSYRPYAQLNVNHYSQFWI